MREVIGNSEIDSAITDGKLKIQSEAAQLLQQILNRYGAGIKCWLSSFRMSIRPGK